MNLDPRILSERMLGGVISRAPLVLLTNWHPGMRPATAPLAALGIEGATLILCNWWSVEAMERFTPEVMTTYLEAMRADARGGGHQLVFFCNTSNEERILRGLGFDARFTANNCLVDDLCNQTGGEEVLFDAVYSAQMVPLKRHELARDVESLLLLYGVFDEAGRARFREVQAMLPYATYSNGDPFAPIGSPDAYRRFTPEDMAIQYRRARTGLCLSHVEGSMLSSIEYLLNGLPVVSTQTLGGRDVFFTGETATMVADDPAEVAAAVAGYARTRPDPADIRRATMAVVDMYRERFANALRDVLGTTGLVIDADAALALTCRLARTSWYGLHDSTVGRVLGGDAAHLIPPLLP